MAKRTPIDHQTSGRSRNAHPDLAWQYFDSAEADLSSACAGSHRRRRVQRLVNLDEAMGKVVHL